MSKFSDQAVFAAFQPYLQSEEFLGNAAYCIYKPPQLVTALVGIMPAALTSKYYVVGLTNLRLIVIRLAKRFGGSIQPAEVFAYSLDQLPEIQATSGFGAALKSGFDVSLRINDPARPFKVGFPMVGVPDNHNRGRMIADRLLSLWQQNQLSISEQTPQSEAIPGAAPLLRSVPASSLQIADSAQFNLQTRPATYVSQSSHKTLGCLGAAMLTVGAGIFQLFALVLFALLQDKTRSSQDVTAGLIGLSVLLLFPATVIVAIGICLIVRGRKKKAAAMSLQRTQATMSVTGQMPRQFPEAQPEPQPEPSLGQVTGFRTENVNSSKVLPDQPQPEEDLGQKEDARGSNCDHEWTRVVDQEGVSLRVYTTCTKCGEVMKPTKTVHYDMR
jgi:hypothetical protein